MKKIYFLYSMIAISLFACSKKQQGTDTFHRLSPEQLAFINTVKTGDTCIWESSLGYRDTGIVQPVVTEKYLISSPSFDGNVYGENAYYTYNFVKKKTKIGYGVLVSADIPNKKSVLLGLAYIDELISPVRSGATIIGGIYNTKKIGRFIYEDVYWTLIYNKDTIVQMDSVFWNKNGILGYHYSEEIVVKIK